MYIYGFKEHKNRKDINTEQKGKLIGVPLLEIG
jgi:hypothetical protein